MKAIDKILNELADIISTNDYYRIEHERLELKDFSFPGKKIVWDNVMQSVCAFLNTEGGIIILGVNEDKENQKYEVKGFNFNNEDSLKDALKKFTNDTKETKDILGQIHFETKDFLNHKIKVMYVDALSALEKYVFYKEIAYERINESDEPIGKLRIEAHKNYKKERQDKKEIKPITTSSIDDLDIEKLKHYIDLVNLEYPVYEKFSTIVDARPFLVAKGMYYERNATILGLLVCGKTPGNFLGFKSQVDAYVEMPANLPTNKKSTNDTVLTLIEQNWAFVFRNIQTGISVEKSGTKTFEYPDQLIRECINNSIAHRDYSINKFVNINIVPSKHIEIKNPGQFKEELLKYDDKTDIPLKRIITTDQRPNNPELAKILNVYQKWEGKGWGMKRLIEECLNDNIDLPYYLFHSKEMLSLFIPKGNLVNKQIDYLLEAHSKFISDKLDSEELSEEQKKIFAYLYKSEIANKNDQWTLLLTKSNNHLKAITSLEESGLISRHSKSDEIHSIFIVDRIFFKKNFNQELRLIYGKEEFDVLKQEYKDSLNAIYLYKHYSKQSKVSANRIGEYLYHKQNGSDFIQKEFDSYKRKIRKAFEQLVERKYLILTEVVTAKGKKESPTENASKRKDDYNLNLNFLKTKSSIGTQGTLNF